MHELNMSDWLMQDKEYWLIQLAQEHLQKIKRYTIENFAESE
jgi:hypothetical protein